MAKDTYYFPHDYNARGNKHIKKLLYKYGMLGYGIWWALCEDLYNNANALPTDYESIAHDLHVGCEVVENVINGFELFQVVDGTFSSDNVQRRIDDRNNKSVKAKESANKRWSHSERNANALPPHSEGNAIKEKKGKERKGNKRIRKEFVAPSLDEFTNYFAENGYMPEVGERAWRGYDAANWFDTKDNEIKNWKQKCQNVWFKPENKKVESTTPKLFVLQDKHRD